MKVIVAGSRTIKFYEIVEALLDKVHNQIGITEVVSGRAKGVDTFGERWAKENGIPIKYFPADWKDLSHPDAIIKEGKYGKYDAFAGLRRNRQMAKYGEYLAALIHNNSSGTKDMIEDMKREGKSGIVWNITSGSKGQDYTAEMAMMCKEERF